MAVAIALADDSVIVREGVERILAGRTGIEVVVPCGDLPSLLEAVASERPDVVVSDIRMPPTSTDEGIRAAAARAASRHRCRRAEQLRRTRVRDGTAGVRLGG